MAAQAVPASAPWARWGSLLLWGALAIQVICAACWALVLSGDEEIFELLEVAALLESSAVTATGLCFLVWQYRFQRKLLVLGLSPVTRPGWSLVWWIVPVATYFMPLRVLRAGLVGLGGEALVKALQLELWWAAWLGYLFFGHFGPGGLLELSLSTGALLQTISMISGCAAALLLMRVLAGAEAAMRGWAETTPAEAA